MFLPFFKRIMLIHTYIIVLSLLLSTHINAKPGRRKGILRQPPEFETWTGKWFPFDPSQSTTTMTTTTTTTTTTEMPISTTKKESTIQNSTSDSLKGAIIPDISTTNGHKPMTNKRKPSKTSSSSSNDSWKGKWFPYPPGTIIPNEEPESICDDGKHSIDMDFDPTDKRNSYKFLCLTKNHSHFEPNMDLEAIETDQLVPPAYVPPKRCLNESITYYGFPPTFGAFRPLPPKFGTYLYLPPQRWLHSTAEGAIVMVYHPCAFPAQVKLLKNMLKSCLYRHIITPSTDLNPERPLVLIAWGKSLQMSVVNERNALKFIKSNAKKGPVQVERTTIDSRSFYEIGLLEEAKLVTDTDDTEICGYNEM